jgi:arylsulfatase A
MLTTNQLKPIAAVLFLICLISSKTFAQQVSPSKPNIIFILADDVGYSVPQVNGGRSYITPHIDSMARNGMNFTHFEASPLCNPSRYMLLTGKYNFRNYSNWGYMSDTSKTIANVMQDAGYTTAMFGKLQLNYSDAIMKGWGWNYHIVFELDGDTVAYRRYKNPVLVENGYRIPDSVTVNKYGDDVLTDKIFDFIKANRTKPFFVYYSMSIGHAPYCPTPDDPQFASWDPNKNKSDTAFYPSMMKYMDKKVGLILERLHASGLDKNTIVFFAGDNGVPPEIYYNIDTAQHVKGEKGSSNEGGTHVPFIAYWPNHVPKGSTNDDLIEFTDFIPTFAQFGNLTNLSKYAPLDGGSFYNAIFGNTYVVNQHLFCHFDPHPDFSDLQRWVRDKTYKLYDSTLTPKAGKFYNTIIDEKEKHPIKNADLTSDEKIIKQNFQNVLDTTPTWPDAPVVGNAASKNITNTTAVVSGAVTDEGASALLKRGSCIVGPNLEGAYLPYGELDDSVAKLGSFSQKRTGLIPQTFYRYSIFAMNNNASHNTAYARDSFYTLSNPPVLQPTSFNAIAGSTSVNLNWSNAKFPNSGAKLAGYLLIYSTGQIKIKQNPNGNQPDSVVVNGTIVPIANSILPKLPPVSVSVSALKTNTTYNFMLIPYTWNGLQTQTYNYLTQGALTTTATTSANISFTSPQNNIQLNNVVVNNSLQIQDQSKK